MSAGSKLGKCLTVPCCNEPILHYLNPVAISSLRSALVGSLKRIYRMPNLKEDGDRSMYLTIVQSESIAAPKFNPHPTHSSFRLVRLGKDYRRFRA